VDNGRDTEPLAENSKVSYFNKFKACINQAVEDRIIAHNPLRGIEGFKVEEKERVYLTLEEVKAMAATECNYPWLKRAFMFSCLTGLRKSDIEKMTWSEVRQQGEFTRIVFKQKKTGGQEYIDLNPQAVEYMGERQQPDDLVFSGFHYSALVNLELKRWAMRAGIQKPVTFHSGRHTFAVLMLDLGADIYTVSKLLGHKEIHTTQIYAKVMDKKKQEAAMLIPDIKKG
jgi:integrase